MIRKLGIIALSGALVACSGEPVTSSSDGTAVTSSSAPAISSAVNSSSSEPAQSSSSAPVIASSSQPTTTSSSPTTALSGAQLYKEHSCNKCHNDDAQNPQLPIKFENWNIDSLTNKIAITMPHTFGEPTDCVGDCARKVAEHVMTLAPEVSCNQPAEPLPQRLRLLTNREYANTINDLLGRDDGFSIVQTFQADTLIAGFDNNADGSEATAGRVDAYWAAAESIAESQTDIEQILGCGQQSQNPTQDDVRRCADQFIPSFGEQVFRRPLTVEEVTLYKDLFNTASTRVEGFKYALQAFLSSPNFLYRSEIGEAEGGNFKLTGYEVASLLSYSFWGSMPDEDLMRAAKDGHLSDTNTLKQQAERLLSDPRAKTQLAHFGRQWFHVGELESQQKEPELFPDYTPEIGRLMEQELNLYLEEVFLGDSGEGMSVSDIYTANFTYLNNQLAQYYGVAGASTNDFEKVTVDSQRSGLLTKGALLTVNGTSKENNPIKRGLLIREHLLCQEFGVPPANVGEIEPLDPNKPLRERLLAHSSNEACASCHIHIDPLGFAFEHYDAAGKYRDREGNDLPIDSAGTLIGITSMAGTDKYPFNGLSEMASILAIDGADQIAFCAAEQFERYFDGVAKPDSCSVESTVARWQAAGQNLAELWLAPLTDPNFSVRQ